MLFSLYMKNASCFSGCCTGSDCIVGVRIKTVSPFLSSCTRSGRIMNVPMKTACAVVRWGLRMVDGQFLRFHRISYSQKSFGSMASGSGLVTGQTSVIQSAYRTVAGIWERMGMPGTLAPFINPSSVSRELRGDTQGR